MARTTKQSTRRSRYNAAQARKRAMQQRADFERTFAEQLHTLTAKGVKIKLNVR